ncbi:MAG: hypothetical protein ACT4OV_16570 [Microthrixaceae bacterium]
MTDDRWHASRPTHGPDPHTSDTVGDEHDEWVVAMLDALDDEQTDAVLDGTVAVEGLEAVVAVVRRLRASAAAEPVPPMSAALRALLDQQAVPSLPARRIARGALVRAAVAAAVTVVALVGAGAAQNRLPTGIQDVVSSTAELVGIDVPRSEDRGAPPSAPEDHDGNAPDAEKDDAADPGGPDGTERPGTGSPPADPDRADPGTPGDKKPATPPAGSNGGGGGNDKSKEKADRSSGGSATNGSANGSGVAGGNGNGSANSNPNGQANGTGNTKK